MSQRLCSPAGVLLLAAQFALVAAGASNARSASLEFEQAAAQTSPALDALWQEAHRQFGAFRYEAAVEALDRLIGALTASATTERPDLLVQAYEMRARARFATGDAAGAEADFVRLVELRPDFAPAAGISPRVVALFTSIKSRMVGQVLLEVTQPAADVTIDGRPYAIREELRPIELLAGQHTLVASRRAYRTVTQPFTVNAGETITLAIALERTIATLILTTEPDGVDVVIDGLPQGSTRPGEPGAKTSASLMVDLDPGVHQLQLKRPCYVAVEREVRIDRLDDVTVGPIQLSPAVSSAAVETDEPGAAIFLDGAPRGPAATADLAAVCEGEHVLEVRSPRGRFIHREVWRAGERKVIKAVLEPAFAMVGMPDARSRAPVPPVANVVERVLQDVPGVLVYVPVETELKAAIDGENLSAETLGAVLSDGTANRNRERVRDVCSGLVARLRAQGVAWVAPAADTSGTVMLSLLATGSGRPDVLTFHPTDPGSRDQVLARLKKSVPPLLRRTLELSVIDVLNLEGAAIVRVPADSAAAQAGLVAGEVIVGAGGRPVASVAELQTQVAGASAGSPLPLEVRGRDGRMRTVSVAVVDAPNPMPLRDRSLAYNKILLEMEAAAQGSGHALEQAVARLNLAIAHLSLANWDEALRALQQVTLPDRAGVSSATVAYLMGLCYEALGRTAEARAAFTRAAAATESTLWFDGPPVRPLARQKMSAQR